MRSSYRRWGSTMGVAIGSTCYLKGFAAQMSRPTLKSIEMQSADIAYLYN